MILRATHPHADFLYSLFHARVVNINSFNNIRFTSDQMMFCLLFQCKFSNSIVALCLPLPVILRTNKTDVNLLIKLHYLVLFIIINVYPFPSSILYPECKSMAQLCLTTFTYSMYIGAVSRVLCPIPSSAQFHSQAQLTERSFICRRKRNYNDIDSETT